MLGILFIYYIGNYFYKLAGIHSKNEWGFAILGVVSYYGGQLLFGVIAYSVIMTFTEIDIDVMDETALNLTGIPIGFLICYLLYKILEKRWENENIAPINVDILDDDLI